MDRKLSSFFLNVGDKLHVCGSDLLCQLGDKLKSEHSNAMRLSQTSFLETSCPLVSIKENGFVDTLCVLTGPVS